MKPVMSSINPEQIQDRAEIAFNTILAHYNNKSVADDVRDNLQDIMRSTDDHVVTPYHMLVAFHRSGLLNSFLDQTVGSAEVLLQGLRLFHNQFNSLNMPHNSDGYTNLPYITDKDPDYAVVCVKAADYLRGIGEADKAIQRTHSSPRQQQIQNNINRKFKLNQQEEPLTEQTIESMPALADEIFCRGIVSNLENSGHSVLKAAAKATALPASVAATKHILERRFHVQLFSDKIDQEMKASRYYRFKPARCAIVAKYMSELLELKHKAMPAPTDEINDQINYKIYPQVIERLVATAEILSKPTERGEPQI